MEKIDIIQWSDDPKTYIAKALSPAKNFTVQINEEEKIATVIVPKDELSLAIGKEGQNVRIASKLTGYRIEIEGKEEALEVDPNLEVIAKESISIEQSTADIPGEITESVEVEKSEDASTNDEQATTPVQISVPPVEKNN